MVSTGPIEDRLAIRELLEAYSDGVCQNSIDIWGATWAEDSNWKLPAIPGMENISGKAAILEAWKGGMGLFNFVVMVTTPGLITINGDTATGRVYTSEVAEMKDGNLLRPRGQYDDEYVKINGQWLFKSRTFKVLHGE